VPKIDLADDELAAVIAAIRGVSRRPRRRPRATSGLGGRHAARKWGGRHRGPPSRNL
jgi:hypothetical protein